MITIMIWCLRIMAFLSIAAWFFPTLIYFVMILTLGSGNESDEQARQSGDALAVAFALGIIPFLASTVTAFFVALVCLTAAELLGVAVRLDRNIYQAALVSTAQISAGQQPVPAVRQD